MLSPKGQACIPDFRFAMFTHVFFEMGPLTSLKQIPPKILGPSLSRFELYSLLRQVDRPDKPINQNTCYQHQ